jgi:hypothetical protein
MSNQNKTLELSDEQLEQVIGGHHRHHRHRRYSSVHKTSYSVVVEQHQSYTITWDAGNINQSASNTVIVANING